MKTLSTLLGSCAGILVLLVGCTDQTGAPPTALDDSQALTVGPMLRSVSGLEVSRQQMRALLDRTTRELALSLSNPAIRTLVFNQLHTSPYRENKRHFGTLLRGNGRELLGEMARKGQIADASVLAALDSIIDVEFYMPVKEHWRDWDGGPNLLVASVLRDDGTIPTAFDLAGQEVKLLSAEEPPEIPTLVLVPVETDFSNTSSMNTTFGSALIQSEPGIYMTSATIYDDHEGWGMGNPEFEVHAWLTDTTGVGIDVQCAGEKRVGEPFFYNQDGQSWSGDVLLIRESELQEGTDLELHMWEDDPGNSPCKLFSGRPPEPDETVASEVNNMLPDIMIVIHTSDGNPLVETLIKTGKSNVRFFINLPFSGDDFVGAFILTGSPPKCFPTTGPAEFRLQKTTDPSGGTAYVEFRTMGSQTPECSPPPDPLPPGSVSIFGPSMVLPNDFCFYTGSATGGTAPYQYNWKKGTQPIGSGSSVNVDTGTQGFSLILDVFDAGGRPGSTTLNVTVSSGAMQCFN